MSERLSIVIPNDLKKELEQMKKLTHLDQSSLIRQLLYEAIQKKKVDIATTQYQERKISLGNATQVAGLSMWEFLDELRKRQIPLDYSMEDAKKEIEDVEHGVHEKFLKKNNQN